MPFHDSWKNRARRGSLDPAETADRQVSLPGLFLDRRLQCVRGRETRAQRGDFPRIVKLDLDPESGLSVALYNPRRRTWSDHFSWTHGGHGSQEKHLPGEPPYCTATESFNCRERQIVLGSSWLASTESNCVTGPTERLGKVILGCGTVGRRPRRPMGTVMPRRQAV